VDPAVFVRKRESLRILPHLSTYSDLDQKDRAGKQGKEPPRLQNNASPMPWELTARQTGWQFATNPILMMLMIPKPQRFSDEA